MKFLGLSLDLSGYDEVVYAPSANTAFTVDLAHGSIQILPTSGNCTITLPGSVIGKSYMISIPFGGAHTITWAGGSTIKWAGGTAPTPTSVSGKTDDYGFWCDGTYTHGSVLGQNY